jgi:Serine/threonine protein kinase
VGEDWVLAGRYRVDAPIGSGGMGEVWRGYDLQLDRMVAIKLMHRRTIQARPGSAEEAELIKAAEISRERFLREIRTTARLEHIGIPAVFDFGTDPETDRIYLVMQLLYGQTLSEMPGPHAVSWAAAVAAQMATILVDVHRVDVVHRDIKPSNIMITDGGLVRLLDFGVAVLQGAAALPRLTQVGQTVGSPPYMSREQALGNPVGAPADVYSLGCVLHEMLTGALPFIETPTRSYQDHHINTPPRSMRSIAPDIPATVDDLVLRMLAKQPGDRPTAEEVYETLLPLAQPSGHERSTVDDDGRDPRRPFVRPLAPAPRRRRRAARPADGRPVEPLSIDEAIEIRKQVRALVTDGHLQPAIDLLSDAVDRAAHNPELELEVSVDLATTLYAADEFSRAAPLLNRIVPELAKRDGEENETVLYLSYIAGVSNAEAGRPEAALAHLTAFLSHTNTTDAVYIDARYQRGLMLHAVGRTEEGIAELSGLLPLLVQQYGADSVHVRSLDRRIEQLRRHTAQ